LSNALPLVLTAQQLATHLQDRNLLIIDLSSVEHYAEGHIPGAISLDPHRLLRGEGNVPNKLPHPEQLTALFSELGITPDTQVVAYDDQCGPWAGRLIWTLACVGHLKASFLDGQLAGWKAAQQPLESRSNKPQPTAFQAQYNDSLVVDIPWLLAQLHRPEVQIWDARSAEEYRGDKIINAKVGGHLPGARWLEWTDLLQSGPVPYLRPREELQQLLANAGLDGSKTLVTHCQTHRRSGLTWLVGRWLGLKDIRCYDGSWFEWGNTPNLPVER